MLYHRCVCCVWRVCETVCVLRVHYFHYPRALRCLLATMIDLPRSRNGKSAAPAHVMRLHPCTRVEIMVERIRVPPNTTHDHGGLHFLTPIVVLHVSALRRNKLGGLLPFPHRLAQLGAKPNHGCDVSKSPLHVTLLRDVRQGEVRRLLCVLSGTHAGRHGRETRHHALLGAGVYR